MALSPKLYEYERLWHEWLELYKAAPPQPLREDNWYLICGFLNHCSICGGPIEEKLLVIPPVLGGKLYTFNVLPACEVCARRVRQSQGLNPVKSLYTITGSNHNLVDMGLGYLRSIMLGKKPMKFNYDEDALEIIVTCPETTSIKAFSGIYATRVFKPGTVKVLKKESTFEANRLEEYDNVTWRLLDESDTW